MSSSTLFVHNACIFQGTSFTQQKAFAWNTEQVLAIFKGPFFPSVIFGDFWRIYLNRKLYNENSLVWEEKIDMTRAGDGSDLRFNI